MENLKAAVKMTGMILAGKEMEDTEYKCRTVKYDKEAECIYLVLEGAEIDGISLDGIYKCTVYKDGYGLCCEGRITERYCNHEGNILCFQIDRGFYKININCVDKAEV